LHANEETNIFSSDERILDSKVYSTSNNVTWPRIPETLESLCIWVKTNIKYLDDEKRWQKQYWQTSEETLYYKTGDCEDFATLFSDILQKWGYDSKIINYMWIDKKSKWLNGHSVCIFGYNSKLYIIDNKCIPKALPSSIHSYDEIVSCLEIDWRIYEVYQNKDTRLFKKIKGINGIIKG